jgi:hypothetical protein
LIIFTKDESPAFKSVRLSNADKVCHKNNGSWLFLLLCKYFFKLNVGYSYKILVAVLAISAALLWTQNRYFTERLQRLQTSIPSPFELGYMNTTALSSKNSTPHSNRRSTVAPFSNDPFSR